MAKKQTRRSISVRGVTYAKLREYCAVQQVSISDFLEQRIADYFDALPAGSRPTATAPLAPRKPVAEPISDRVIRAVENKPAPRIAAAPPERPARTPQPAARVQPVLTPRPVPASSTINRPMPVAARRSVAPAPPVHIEAPRIATGANVGRPAPTPAQTVLKQPATPRDVKDYRALRF